MMKYFTPIILFTLTSFGNAVGQNYTDSLDLKLTDIYQGSGLPGFSVSIVDGNGVLFSQGYGYANKERRIPYTDHTNQSIASISKTFIALALMQSIEEGQFTLETPINDLLPFKVMNPNVDNDTIRVKHLATHTSGILDGDAYWSKGFYLLEPPLFETKLYTQGERDFFEMILPNHRIDDATFLRNYLMPEGNWYSTDHYGQVEAGASFEYSNIGAALAAYIIEIVQQTPYWEYIKYQVFLPLGMTSTRWDFEDTVHPQNEAVKYLNQGDPCPEYSFSTYADGAVRSSVEDLQKYLIEMIKGSIGKGSMVSSQGYNAIFSQRLDIDESDGMGLFWFTQKRLGDRFHQGSGAGTTTVISFNPNLKLGCIILCNHETDTIKQSEAYVAVWKALIKYREVLTLNHSKDHKND